MRWDLLFDDLGWQLDQERRAEERSLALEEERLRLSRLTIRDRIVALTTAADGIGRGVRFQLRGGDQVHVRPTSFGSDWMTADVVDGPSGGGCVIPLAAIVAILPDRDRIDASLARVADGTIAIGDRIPLPFVLRDLSRRRAPVTVSTDEGRLHGTFDRVGRDHVDLALHEPGSPRRDRNVQGYRIVPLHVIRLVAFD